MSPDPTSDTANLRALQQGEDLALNRLIARWQQPLLGFAFRYVHNDADAQDVVAETFVRLYQNRHRLRPDSNLSAWLFTTLSNLCRNHHRWRLRHPSVGSLAPKDPDRGSPPSDSAPPDDHPDPATLAHLDEAAIAVKNAIAQLPHDLKTTLLLHHYEERSHREIGLVVGCSERGVETRLYRAKQRLRKLLAPFLQETTPR